MEGMCNESDLSHRQAIRLHNTDRNLYIDAHYALLVSQSLPGCL